MIHPGQAPQANASPFPAVDVARNLASSHRSLRHKQLAQALAEVRQPLGEAQRLATEAQRGVQTTTTLTGQVDPRVINKCPTFSGRDTEWSEWSFIFESVAAMADLESLMEGAFSGLAETPFAELTPEVHSP